MILCSYTGTYDEMLLKCYSAVQITLGYARSQVSIQTIFFNAFGFTVLMVTGVPLVLWLTKQPDPSFNFWIDIDSCTTPNTPTSL